MPCDPKDRHVLAAAVHDAADFVVTFNLKDFPPEGAAQHGIEIVHPDAFLTGMLAQHAETVISALQRATAAFKHPPRTVVEFLASLTTTVPMFANLAADALIDPPGPVSPVPVLVTSDEEAGVAAFGDPGDMTNPAQVALLWWAGLMDDPTLVRDLTYDPRAWGDYQWAVEHLADRSLASKVLRAVDDPDRIAFVRFIQEVSSASQIFEAYVTGMTFLTLVKVQDGTWRVWGLGPGMPAARDVS